MWFESKAEAKQWYEDDEEKSEIINRKRYICPFCKETHECEDEARECCTWNYFTRSNKQVYECESCHTYYLESEVEESYNEPYEWWFVTDWFAEKLQEHGEMVIRGWHNIWGRTCTGQSIILDWVVGKIAEEMEILEGMKHDWSKY